MESQHSHPEVWGGIECTVNRVGDVFFDQMERNGHAERVSDLDRVAELGITAIRYPVVWERLVSDPDGISRIDWSWSDERLTRLRELGVRPIVGLVHHGSGPRHTSLTEPSFASGLSEFARVVAERYPWVEDFTPVNEPLTTARFSGLYGVWYPHGRDELTFARAYLNQVRAIVLAMREIRQVNPGARLIQTEDLGKTHSSPLLAYQADMENERRWLTYDLLTGNLNPDLPMWDYLKHVGVSEAELHWFGANPCPPDVLGVNHYLTSERYLDERLRLFPGHSHGGNGRHRYADVEAVRVAGVELAGFKGLLRETWDRYQRPLAITELHLGCTREEQLRWFADGWEVAKELRSGGVDVRAVTAWSLLGSFDWNCLVTRINGFYEPGVFDVSGAEPRPTALAGLVKDLAAGREPAHPALAGAGWWRRPDRWMYPFDHPLVDPQHQTTQQLHLGSTRVVIVSDGIADDSPIARLCHMRGLPLLAIDPGEMDFAEPELSLDRLEPWAVIVDVLDREDGSNTAEASIDGHFERIQSLGRYCAVRHIPLMILLNTAYAPDDESREVDVLTSLTPLQATPDATESKLLEELPNSLIIRGGANAVLNGKQDDAESAMEEPYQGRSTCVSEHDLLNASLDLLIDGESGVWGVDAGS